MRTLGLNIYRYMRGKNSLEEYININDYLYI
jgi:hypothetical protein